MFSNFVILFQNCLAIPGCLYFHLNLGSPCRFLQNGYPFLNLEDFSFRSLRLLREELKLTHCSLRGYNKGFRRDTCCRGTAPS